MDVAGIALLFFPASSIAPMGYSIQGYTIISGLMSGGLTTVFVLIIAPKKLIQVFQWRTNRTKTKLFVQFGSYIRAALSIRMQ